MSVILMTTLFGSTFHVDNKTNEQSAFTITPFWVQNTCSCWVRVNLNWSNGTSFFAFLLVQKVHVTTDVTLWETWRKWNDSKLLRCQQHGKKFALFFNFFCKKRWPYLQSFNERRVVGIAWTSSGTRRHFKYSSCLLHLWIKSFFR